MTLVSTPQLLVDHDPWADLMEIARELSDLPCTRDLGIRVARVADAVAQLQDNTQGDLDGLHPAT